MVLPAVSVGVTSSALRALEVHAPFNGSTAADFLAAGGARHFGEAAVHSQDVWNDDKQTAAHHSDWL